jgi:sortase
MRIGERAIEGVIQEKEEARKTYEKAKTEGRKAALVEQQRPNLFTNSVAHIGPNEQVRVTIEYQQTLAYDNGEYRLRFPLAVTPRYIPASASGHAMPDEPKAIEAFSMDGPVQTPAYAVDTAGALVNPVDIAVMIDAGVPIAAVESSYHEAIVEKSAGHRAAVYLSRSQEAADRDFELKWRLASGGEPQAAVFTQNVAGSDYGLVMVVPPQPTAAEKAAFQGIPREIVVIVDTSGSMAGASMEQAKQAVAFALDTLTERDRFNVVEFNSVTKPMYPASLPATRANLAQAKQWVGKLQAGGGTEMVAALKFALDGASTPGYLRQVIFMTDGGVSNEEELFRLIATRLGESRLFTGRHRLGAQRPLHDQGRAVRPRHLHLRGQRAGSEREDDAALRAHRGAGAARRDAALVRRHADADLSRARARPLPGRARRRLRRRRFVRAHRDRLRHARQPTLERGAHSCQRLGRRGRPLGQGEDRLPHGRDHARRRRGQAAPGGDPRGHRPSPGERVHEPRRRGRDAEQQRHGEDRAGEGEPAARLAAGDPADGRRIDAPPPSRFAGTGKRRNRGRDRAHGSGGEGRVKRWIAWLVVILTTVGGWQVAHAGWIHAKAIVAQELIASAWKDARAGHVARRPWPWADMRPVARLSVPAHRVELFVLDNASNRALAFGPAHVGGTAAPGGPGNAVIVAHRDTHFAFLRDLHEDDVIDVETARGAARYRVREVAIVDKSETRVLEAADSPQLTLITCYPFDSVRSGTALRYVVIADRAG